MYATSSNPSISTAGNSIATSLASGLSTAGRLYSKQAVISTRGAYLLQGRLRRPLLYILFLLWKPFWQRTVVVSIVYHYIAQLLLMYFWGSEGGLQHALRWVCELLFVLDVLLRLLHAYWPVLRSYMRAYRVRTLLLVYDACSIFPWNLFFIGTSLYNDVYLFRRWLVILRIYRLQSFYFSFNESIFQNHMHRRLTMLAQHASAGALLLHAVTCYWYHLHVSAVVIDANRIVNYYKSSIGLQKITFNSYLNCWYYCMCRLFNCIFGDCYAKTDFDKWLTSFLVLSGFVLVKYRFIGEYTWELICHLSRRVTFIDEYHHMIQYLKFHRASPELVSQAAGYKRALWLMKDGVIAAPHFTLLPASMQTELIFDINVGHLQRSIVLKGVDDSVLRYIATEIKHEVFLEGQTIWHQGVVKSGMICVKQGVIELLSEEDDESPVIAFAQGTVLGELSLFYSIPAKVSVKAASFVEIQVLQRTDLLKKLGDNQHMLNTMRNKIWTRVAECKQRQKSIVNYDKNDVRVIRTRYRPMKVLKDALVGVSDDDAVFEEDSHMFYRDENNQRREKFTREYLSLYQLSEHVTTVMKPRICLRSTFPWILEPETNLTRLFDVIHFVKVIYICFMCPYTATANYLPEWMYFVSAIVTVGLFFNIYLQLTTAIVQKNDRKVTVKEIAAVKMASIGFYLDVISVFPVYIFTETLDPDRRSIGSTLGLLFPMLQIWHINDYMDRWEKSFYANLKFICVTKYSLLLVILSYWAGFFLYLFACPESICKSYSWFWNLMYFETKMVVKAQSRHEAPLGTAIGYGTSIITLSGSTDILPGSSDLLLVLTFMLIGATVYCLYTAKLAAIYIVESRREQIFKSSMRELFYFLTVNHVSSKIKARVKKFFSVQWHYNKGVTSEELFTNMSANIQQDVVSLDRVEMLLCCPLFQNCSRDFLQTVAASGRNIVLPDSEVVQHGADISRDMYIINKGHCYLLDSSGTVVGSVGAGGHFGMLETLYGLPKVYTVVTTTNSVVLQLEYSGLLQSLNNFPDVMQPINVVLEDPELLKEIKPFEKPMPMTGKIEKQSNRLAQEIKESFIVLNGVAEKKHFDEKFFELGVLRYLRYIVVPVCITPYGMFLKMWCAFRFVLAILYLIKIPFNWGVSNQKHGGTFDNLDLVLYLDLVVMGYVAYYDERSLAITHSLYTIIHYLKHAFLLDILSVFPFEILASILKEDIDHDSYRLNRILQVFRITGAFSYWENDIMGVSQAVVLFKYLPIALTVANVATAYVFQSECKISMDPTTHQLMSNCTGPFILHEKNAHLEYASSEYIHRFYWIFQLLLGQGCSPYYITNINQGWTVIVLQIFSVLYFVFMYAYVTSTNVTSSDALLKHKENTRDLANFLYQENVESMLTAKTLKYFEYVWKRTNGSNPQRLCRRLNSALMEDTLVFMYEKTLREVPLFAAVDRSFIRVVTQNLTEMYFLRGETVVQCRDVQSSIYIIYRGKVDVLSSYNEMVTCMGPGGMFGNFTGKSISCSGVSVYASRSLDLLEIKTETFFNLIKMYPKVQETLLKAFEVSNDYILPISMDLGGDDTSSDSDLPSSSDDSSMDQSISGRSTSTASVRTSQSNLSQSQKSATSVGTFQSHKIKNILRPGTVENQGLGYLTCVMATFSYMLVLYDIVTINHCPIIFWAHCVTDVFFYFEVFSTMHQGYVTKSGILIMASGKCRSKYFRKKFKMWSDVFCNIPLEIFAFCFITIWRPTRTIHYLRANKMLRLKYLVEFYRITSAELINNATKLQIWMSVFVGMILLHSFTCFWLLVLTGRGEYINIRTIKTYMFIDTAINQKRWDYMTSFYQVTAHLTTTGGDEYRTDESSLSKSILACAMISGKMLAAIVVATSLQFIYSTRHALADYEKSMMVLIDVLRNQGLSDYQMKKFWTYIQQLWTSDRGRQLPTLLASTPYGRRCDLMSAMFGHHLRNCFLFTDTGEPFLRQITAVLEYNIYFPGNYVVLSGDSEARMFWVAGGAVSVVSVRADLTETVHELLGPGDMFGIVQGLSRGIPHVFSYRAESKVCILSLPLESWIHILPFFPEAENVLNLKSQQLYTNHI